MNKKNAIIFASLAAAFVVIMIVLLFVVNKNKKEIVYKETTVEKGDLTVGITESGSVTMGTIEQTFDLDLSAFEASASGGASSSMGGGMFPNMAGNNSSSSAEKDYSRALDVEEVFVTVGQKTAEGDVLFSLTEESVASIKEELEADEASAKLTLEKLQNDQKQSRLTAVHTKETSEAYAQLAQNEYAVTVQELQQDIDDKQKEIDTAVETVSENQVKLEVKIQELIAAEKVLENAEYAVQTADTALIYEYGKQEDARDLAKSQADSLRDEIDLLEEKNEELTDQDAGLQLELNDLKRQLETGTLEAQKTYNQRITTGSDASEAYAVTVGYLDADLLDAQDNYDEAVKKLEEFAAYIADNQVCAEYNGIITAVGVEKGDSLSSSQSLISLNNQDDTTIAVEVKEDDMASISTDSPINLCIDSYPDVIFTGTVEEIGDAVTDSTTGAITCEITVLIQGDVSGLYEEMTGDVTFITKETKEVSYVSNRAIIRKGTKSYVKIKEESGKIVVKEVKTGFSDGIHVEITEGLSEGDIVLIESKVTEE